LQKETPSHKTYQLLSDHAPESSICKFRVLHICRQSGTDVDYRDDQNFYEPIASIYQSDLEFLVPAGHDTYIDLNMQLYVRGQLTKTDVAELEISDHTAGTNNF
jgi:hypothetical protein